MAKKITKWEPEGFELEMTTHWDTARLEQLLVGYSCAWDLRVPTEEEYPEVPVTLKSNWLTRSMTCITEQYSMPAYDGVEKSPAMQLKMGYIYFSLVLGGGLMFLQGTIDLIKTIARIAGKEGACEQ